MICQDIKKLLGLYAEGGLDAQEAADVKKHLGTCEHCRRDLKLYEKSWDMLSHWKDIEPQPGYISRFWTKLSQKKSWHEEILEAVKAVFTQVRFKPVLVAASIVIIVGFLALRIYLPIAAEQTLAKMSLDELEVIENIELAQNFDIIANIDLVEDMDVLENLDSLES